MPTKSTDKAEHTSGSTRKRAPIIAVEGLDGSGKSTTVACLSEALGAVVICNPPQSLAHDRPRADGLPDAERRQWYLAANRVAMDQALAAAEAGRPVVLDRSIASTLAFGAAERGTIASPADLPPSFPLPDHVVLLSVAEEIRRARHAGRRGGVTTEEERLAVDTAFRDRVLAGYRALCTDIVDASRPTGEIVVAILNRIC